MKAVRSLTREPQAMTDYCLAHPDEVAAPPEKSKEVWSRFRDDPAYHVLLDELLAIQQGLCLYCEQRLSDHQGRLVRIDYQVEHVLAKSVASGKTLDWTNLALGCSGGTVPYLTDPARKGTGLDNRSCGAQKADQPLPDDCDPRKWKLSPNLVRVELDGRIEPDPAACRQVGISDADLKTAIDSILDLNCERLRMARQRVGDAIRQWLLSLNNAIQERPKTQRPVALEQVVETRLAPDAVGHLNPFWTTEREVLGPLAESWLGRNLHRFT